MIASLPDITQKAADAFNSGAPFVLYAKPGEHSATAIFQKSPAGNDPKPSRSFVLSSFDGKKRLSISEERSEVFSFQIPDGGLPAPSKPKFSYAEDAKSDFESLVRKAIAAIRTGALGKVVLSRKEIVGITADFMTIYKRVLAAYPTAFRYCWFHPESGLWIGATPEQLLKTENLRFRTVALAGTQPFIDTEHVLWQEKEKDEQRIVTDFISQSLREKVSDMSLSEPYTARAGNLLHIKTDISGTLRGCADLTEILEILHPTPAVCGYPKAEAEKFIIQNEGYDRAFYSGYLGEIGKDSKSGNDGSDLYVNLRCMKIRQNSAHLYVGCGITAGSDPEKEFFETVNKALTMKKVLS